MTIIHPVEEATCTATWLKAAELLAAEDDGTLYNLVLGVASPDRVEAEEFELHDVLNEFLQKRDHYPLSSIAGTIFPASHYLHGGAKAVFNEFPSLYPKMKRELGNLCLSYARPIRH